MGHSNGRANQVIEPHEGTAYNVLGMRITCKLPGARTDGEYAVFWVEAPEGVGPPPHIHSRESETFVLAEGELIVIGAEGERTVGPGAVVDLPCGQVHTFRGGRGGAKFTMVARPSGLEHMFAELHPLSSTGQPPDMDAVVATLARAGVKVAEPVA